MHRICSLFEPLTLADLIEVETGGENDEVLCPGVDGENLAEQALSALRKSGWQHPALHLRIEKRIPVAAGLGGGSADAAAVLRLARGEDVGLRQLAAELGADVPSQLLPAMALVEGAGERVRRLPDPAPARRRPAPGRRRALDRRSLRRSRPTGPRPRAGRARRDLRHGSWPRPGPEPRRLATPSCSRNDLEPAALALRPEIGGAISALREAGAGLAAMTGSGPTAFGIFGDLDSAREAASSLDRDDAIVCEGGPLP